MVKNIPKRRNSVCKGPEMGSVSAHFGFGTAGAAGAQWETRSVCRGGVRAQARAGSRLLRSKSEVHIYFQVQLEAIV